MSNHAFFLLIFGLVSLSVLLLWLRDKYRDFRHVPEAERKADERRTAVGANTVVFLFWAAGSAFRAVKEPAIVPRVVFALVAMVTLGMFLESYGRYRKIGRAE
jgi:hypothetical protein